MSNFANLCICILCAVRRYFLSPPSSISCWRHFTCFAGPGHIEQKQAILLNTHHRQGTDQEHDWRRSKQNYSFLSGCLQSIFFVMDANLQPLRYFVIKSIFSASRPTTPILCFCTTKEEASHGGWKTCNDPTHQQHSMVWGSENIISLTAKVSSNFSSSRWRWCQPSSGQRQNGDKHSRLIPSTSRWPWCERLPHFSLYFNTFVRPEERFKCIITD